MTGRRVAYVLKVFPRFSETFILSELLELERQGVRIEVFSLRPSQDARTHADLARLRASVTYVPAPNWRNAPTLAAAHLRLAIRRPLRYLPLAWHALRRRHRGSWKHFLQAGWTAPRLSAAGIRHVHAHFASSATSVALYLHRLVGLSYSFTAHAKDIFIDGVSQRDLARKIASARFAVTVSDYNLRYLTPLDSHGKLVRIYNGLDLEQFTFARCRRGSEGGDGAPPLILAVGRLIEKKGFADLVHACALLRDNGLEFRCRIVGSGELRDALDCLIGELRLSDRVSLDGPLPREVLLELLLHGDVFAAPCVVGGDGNRDGLPTVLIEAMARGVPVVSTDVTGVPELVQHGRTGLIVPQHDPVALAAALRRLIREPEEANRLAREARREVEARFDLSRNVRELRAMLVGETVGP
ncbi:MAG: glycosyltransferase [Candidatus Limnocylindria bacterium]